ncbi:hypothetical protein EV356DRAFT_263863 [Viridothelium virens]|uniref:Uncharacterized protein n=1 Tax=Viridothelium virens TaxID=1048519 RepID=A0A6A6HLW4_VIRVR|nr:hypothetical protein EV356DRAFT_263863 [Viridothelium virens]
MRVDEGSRPAKVPRQAPCRKSEHGHCRLPAPSCIMGNHLATNCHNLASASAYYDDSLPRKVHFPNFLLSSVSNSAHLPLTTWSSTPGTERLTSCPSLPKIGRATAVRFADIQGCALWAAVGFFGRKPRDPPFQPDLVHLVRLSTAIPHRVSVLACAASDHLTVSLPTQSEESRRGRSASVVDVSTRASAGARSSKLRDPSPRTTQRDPCGVWAH